MRIILALLSVFIFSACSVVSPGERGVRIFLGSASDEVLNPGAHLWIPVFFGLEKVDVQIQKSDVETDAASKDMQPIHTKVSVNWSIAPEQVVSVYKKLGDEEEIYKRIISPAVSEVLKASMAQLTAEEILLKRLILKKSIDDGLKDRLTTYGVNATDVSIIELHFSEQFTKAIEEKQIAEQQAKQAQYVADKAVKDAEAHVNLSKGQAESQKLLQSSISEGILQKMAIEKWDGHFPQYMAGGQLPFLNLKVGK